MSENQAMQRPGPGLGQGLGNVLIALGVAALLAIVVFVFVSVHRDRALRTDAVSSAASSLLATPLRH